MKPNPAPTINIAATMNGKPVSTRKSVTIPIPTAANSAPITAVKRYPKRMITFPLKVDEMGHAINNGPSVTPALVAVPPLTPCTKRGT